MGYRDKATKKNEAAEGGLLLIQARNTAKNPETKQSWNPI